MTEIQYEKKILELNQYLEEINATIWDEICMRSDPVSKETIEKIVEILNEWAVKN